MKFKCSVLIDAPKDKVVACFEDPNALKHWQDGFISMTHLSGQTGAVGAKSKMLYKLGKGEMALIETILINDLPDRFKGQYESKHTSNTMDSIFKVTHGGQTKFVSEIEYTRLNGIIVKVISWLYPSVYKHQVQKWMNQFKAYVESGKSIKK